MPRTPKDFDPAVAKKLLDDIRGVRSLSERTKVISGSFLGYPYTINPLIGSATMPEVFTVSLKGFDCVTYVETVLAFALSSSVAGFVKMIRQIRYKDGQIDWLKRNHYMTGWIKNNAREGFVTNMTRGSNTTIKTRRLSTLEGYPPKAVTFKCLPKRFLSRIKDRLEDGDIIFFASTRKRLDTFHVGLLFRAGEEIYLRHASRSQGGVVSQPLSDFLKKNRMAGVILVRPVKR